MTREELNMHCDLLRKKSNTLQRYMSKRADMENMIKLLEEDGNHMFFISTENQSVTCNILETMKGPLAEFLKHSVEKIDETIEKVLNE